MLSSRALLATALVAAMATSARGQHASAWSELSVPAGASATSVKGQGKLVTYDAGAELHVFSSVTRTWRSYPKSAGATLTLFNDVALLRDGAETLAVSSYFGEPARLTTSASATLWNGAGAKNDSIVLLRDGDQLHAFSAFTGAWTARAIASGATGAVQRHVAVVHSGEQLLGMSAFDGAWRAFDAQGVNGLSADGTAALAFGAELYAFSAHTRAWRSRPAPPGANFVRGDDWALWTGPAGGLAYSGLVGEFCPIALGGAGVVAQSDLYALLGSGGQLHAYSAVTGDVVHVGPAGAAVEVGAGCALLHDAAIVRGYSALTQQVQALALPAVSLGAGAALGYFVDAGGHLHAFSALRGTWTDAPASTIGGAPLVTTCALGLQAPGDCFGYSPESGQFTPLGGAVQGLVGNASSAPLLAYDGLELHAFDAAQSRWITTARAGASAPTFRVWRTTAVVVDGDSAFGVGAQAGRWHRVDLGQHAAAAFANSEVGFLVDGQRLFACGMLAEIAALQQFPAFRRVQPRGAEVAFSTTPVQDALVIAGVAPPATPAALPGLGELHLDLTSATLVALAPAAPSGVAQLRWTPPPTAALAGTTLFAQLLTLPTTGMGAPQLSDRATVQLW